MSQASAPFDINNLPSGIFAIVGTVLSAVWSTITLTVKARVRGVGMKFIFGTDLMVNEVGKVVYNDFLPVALEKGGFVAAPEAEVVGKGLECVQEGMDRSKRGVSAKKVVVSL